MIMSGDRWTEHDLALAEARRRQGERQTRQIIRNVSKTGLVILPGEPCPKPRMTRRDKWLDPPRPAVARYRRWADEARLACGIIKKLRIGATRIRFVAYFSMPESWPNKQRAEMVGQPHLEKPDIDNVLKSICDALFENDQAVWEISGAKKLWTAGESRVELVVY